MKIESHMQEDKSKLVKRLTPEELVDAQRKYGVHLMRSSAFLMNDYLKTFKKDDYNRHCVGDTVKKLTKQVAFEYTESCKKPKFKPHPEYGDLMTINEWKECVKQGGFIDYDGNGDLATDKFVSNIEVCPSDVTFFKVEFPSWATHVMWYNR